MRSSLKAHSPTARSKKAHGHRGITPSDVAGFFAGMNSAFPMWNIDTSAESVKTWHTELQHYNLLDLRRAYQQIMTSASKSPPSLPEIRNLCRGSLREQHDRVAIDSNLSLPPPVSEDRARENIARLRRIMDGMELSAEDHCSFGHLTVAFQSRLRESLRGYPTFRGYAIDPKFIQDPDKREAYQEEIDLWREANQDVR